eukprot:212804-Pyramimonas_sp.AAC.1
MAAACGAAGADFAAVAIAGDEAPALLGAAAAAATGCSLPAAWPRCRSNKQARLPSALIGAEVAPLVSTAGAMLAFLLLPM